MNKPKVAVVRCDSYDGDMVYEALRRGIDLLGGLSVFASPGERILVKPNALAAEKPDRAVTTHPAVFGAVTSETPAMMPLTSASVTVLAPAAAATVAVENVNV